MKNTLSLFSFLLFPFFLFSQNISVGIFQGVNASFLTFEHETFSFLKGPEESKLGYVMGADFKMKISELIALRSGTYIIRKGGQRDINLTDENGNLIGDAILRTNIDYFQIPILVEASFLKDRIFFVNFGYSFDFMTKAVSKAIDFPGEQEDIDESSIFANVDYSILFGLGVKLPVTKKIDFLFEGRWQNGVTDISKSELIKMKNRSVYSVLGLRYHI